MGRKTHAQIEEELRKKILEEYRPLELWRTPTFDYLYNGLETRAIPTGYISITIIKSMPEKAESKVRNG